MEAGSGRAQRVYYTIALAPVRSHQTNTIRRFHRFSQRQ